MKFSMTGQEKGDLLIEVTVWVGLTVLLISFVFFVSIVWCGGKTMEMPCCTIYTCILNQIQNNYNFIGIF